MLVFHLTRKFCLLNFHTLPINLFFYNFISSCLFCGGRVTKQKQKRMKVFKFSTLHYVTLTIEFPDYHVNKKQKYQLVYHCIGHNFDDHFPIAVYKRAAARLRLGRATHVMVYLFFTMLHFIKHWTNYEALYTSYVLFLLTTITLRIHNFIITS